MPLSPRLNEAAKRVPRPKSGNVGSIGLLRATVQRRRESSNMHTKRTLADKQLLRAMAAFDNTGPSAEEWWRLSFHFPNLLPKEIYELPFDHVVEMNNAYGHKPQSKNWWLKSDNHSWRAARTANHHLLQRA